ncbi:hypothetical protein FQN57_001860 [Myotisia sp. PD_48]|nr:hypothetical protein FQN57_001860 [Myotisia sp. PD_48]
MARKRVGSVGPKAHSSVRKSRKAPPRNKHAERLILADTIDRNGQLADIACDFCHASFSLCLIDKVSVSCSTCLRSNMTCSGSSTISRDWQKLCDRETGLVNSIKCVQTTLDQLAAEILVREKEIALLRSSQQSFQQDQDRFHQRLVVVHQEQQSFRSRPSVSPNVDSFDFEILQELLSHSPSS